MKLITFIAALTLVASTSAQQPQPAPIPAPPDVAAAPPDAGVTATGLASKVIQPGTGTEHPITVSTVRVHYTGWTTDGRMFDSSVVRGEPSAFALNRVIRGWTEGVQLMVKGEKRRFWIPSALAYGENPRPGAPRGMLVFDVELFEFTTPADAAMHVTGFVKHRAMATASPYKLIPWQSIGPSNYSGRMTSVAVADVAGPRGQRSIYVGAAAGGVWKSTNRGLTWRPVFEKEASGGIGAVAVAPSNPLIVWVGTGESSLLRATVPGTGVYKSIDAGRTWQHAGLADTGAISRILVHPINPNIVYVAASGKQWTANDLRGVFKTSDGGKTWVKVFYRNPNTGAVDLVMDSKNPETLIVTTRQGLRRKWTDVRGDPNFAEGQAFKTTDGGTTWLPDAVRQPMAPGRVWIDPRNPKVIYTAHDKGFTMTEDGGRTKREATGIRGAQFSNLELDSSVPFRAYGSMPDAGSVRVAVDAGKGRAMFAPIRWLPAPMRSTDIKMPNEPGLREQVPAPLVISPFDPMTLYAGYQYVYRSRDRGLTWQRISDDLTDNNARLAAPKPEAAVAYQTITHIAESPLTRGVVYAGTDDGNLHVTRDAGQTWTNIGRNLPMTLKKWVSRIVPSKYDAGTVYVSQRGREDDDFAAYLWKSTDHGATWTSVVGTIPSGSINVVREDPVMKDVLYAGNDFGVYVSKDAGRTWHVLGANLPIVQVSDLQIHPRDGFIVISTYGRGVWVMDARKVRITG